MPPTTRPSLPSPPAYDSGMSAPAATKQNPSLLLPPTHAPTPEPQQYHRLRLVHTQDLWTSPPPAAQRSPPRLEPSVLLRAAACTAVRRDTTPASVRTDPPVPSELP